MTLAYGVLAGGGVCARLDGRVLNLSASIRCSTRLAQTVHGRGPEFRRELAARLEEGREVERRSWSCPSRWPTTSTSTCPAPRREPRAGCSGPTASRCCPTGAPAGRLPRPRRDGRRSRHAGAAPERAAGGEGRRLRPHPAARHRARGRVRRRRAEPIGAPRVRRACARPRVRRGAGQRLVGPGHPGLGVPAARPVPRQVVRHVVSPWVVPLDALDGPRPGPAQDPPAAALPARGRPHLGLDIALEVRWNGSRGRPRGRRAPCTGRRPADRPPDGQRRVAADRRPVRLRHGVRARTGSAAA